MKSNRTVLIIFTIVFFVAVLINVKPSGKVVGESISVFSNNDRTDMIMAIYNGIKVDNTPVYITTDEKSNSDIKLKYNSCISTEEQKQYNIYKVRKEKLYSITKKGNGIRLTYLDIERFFNDKNNQFTNKLLLFTPNTSVWIDNYRKDNNKPYVYKPLENIIGEDETVIAIAFGSEISDLSKYDVNVIYKDNKEVEDNFCILIKKDKFGKDDEDKILSGLKKEITKLKGESNE
ncbi:hypothetical protein [Clostridium folliculivorans]|uniref:Uncharacterized protein n=1 Tax=Clostridium folliculivorans TaxID=2886038 RepID=A0A9W6DCE1_9CLOT|nr:hypothetical protein [Clostridium folliculivorans]GKU26911.1 hypothetical protein CFOLD11_37380 [Clostridium folliculivorans]GKU31562.1 hypothetical protein CFB3_36690 [Clostridium folliculivorans]